MVVEFKPRSVNDRGSPKSHINAVIAKENVTVDYNHDFIAAADRATFHREEGASLQHGLSGIIRMHADGPDGHCHVTNRNGDLIHARQIFIDTLHRRLNFAHPKGALFTLRTGYSKERIDFSSDTLNWDERTGALNLRGHVWISQKGFGQLKSDGEVTLFQSSEQGRKQLSTIECYGPTTLIYQAESKKRVSDTDLSHIIQCWGKMVVDHDHLQVVMESPEPSEQEETVRQVYYNDKQGSLFADRMEVKYKLSEGRLVPLKVILNGSVKMLNKPISESEKLQYALADRVEISFATQEALLSADSDKRVLVLDQVNDLQVSAPALKIKRNEATKKDSIQGMGDVRFNFQDPEFERLYKRFDQLQKQVEKHE